MVEKKKGYMMYTLSLVGEASTGFQKCKKNSYIEILERIRYWYCICPTCLWYWRYVNLPVCMMGVAVRKGRKWKKKFIRARQTFRGDVKWTRKKLPFKRLTIRMWRKFVADVWKCKKKTPFWNTRAHQIIIQTVQLDDLIVLTHNLTIIWRDFVNLTIWKKF